MVEATPEITMRDETSEVKVNNNFDLDDDDMLLEAVAANEIPMLEQLVSYEENKSETRKPLFKNLNSNLCMALVLGYLLSYEQAEAFFKCLNKSSLSFWNKHKAQYRHFIDDKPIGDIPVMFGDKSCQYIRPKPHSSINVLGLCNVIKDLYQIETFAKETMRMKELRVGHRAF